ncbi:hypothetical protein BDZ88DRAFT_91884 [Geranomyces variabilis]|nr:hypothetical protein BDZ88DRAFT_91884 [Geranomyces variabilis]
MKTTDILGLLLPPFCVYANRTRSGSARARLDECGRVQVHSQRPRVPSLCVVSGHVHECVGAGGLRRTSKKPGHMLTCVSARRAPLRNYHVCHHARGPTHGSQHQSQWTSQRSFSSSQHLHSSYFYSSTACRLPRRSGRRRLRRRRSRAGGRRRGGCRGPMLASSLVGSYKLVHADQ